MSWITLSPVFITSLQPFFPPFFTEQEHENLESIRIPSSSVGPQNPPSMMCTDIPEYTQPEATNNHMCQDCDTTDADGPSTSAITLSKWEIPLIVLLYLISLAGFYIFPVSTSTFPHWSTGTDWIKWWKPRRVNRQREE